MHAIEERTASNGGFSTMVMCNANLFLVDKEKHCQKVKTWFQQSTLIVPQTHVYKLSKQYVHALRWTTYQF